MSSRSRVYRYSALLSVLAAAGGIAVQSRDADAAPGPRALSSYAMMNPDLGDPGTGLPIDSGEAVVWPTHPFRPVPDAEGNLVVPFASQRGGTFAALWDKTAKQWKLWAFDPDNAGDGVGVWSGGTPGAPPIAMDILERQYYVWGFGDLCFTLVHGEGFAPYLFGVLGPSHLSGTALADDHGESRGILFDGARWQKWEPGVTTGGGMPAPNATRGEGAKISPVLTMFGSAERGAFAWNPNGERGLGFIGHNPTDVHHMTGLVAARYYPPTASVQQDQDDRSNIRFYKVRNPGSSRWMPRYMEGNVETGEEYHDGNWGFARNPNYIFPWYGGGDPGQPVWGVGSPSIAASAVEDDGDFYAVMGAWQGTSSSQLWATWYRANDDLGRPLDRWYRWCGPAQGWVDVADVEPTTAPVSIAGTGPGAAQIVAGANPPRVYAIHDYAGIHVVPYDLTTRQWGSAEAAPGGGAGAGYATAIATVQVGETARDYVWVAYGRRVSEACENDPRDEVCLKAYDPAGVPGSRWGAWVKDAGTQQWGFVADDETTTHVEVVCRAQYMSARVLGLHVYAEEGSPPAPVITLSAAVTAAPFAPGKRLFAATTADYAATSGDPVPRREIRAEAITHIAKASAKYVDLRAADGKPYSLCLNSVARLDISPSADTPSDVWLVSTNFYRHFYWHDMATCLPSVAPPAPPCQNGTAMLDLHLMFQTGVAVFDQDPNDGCPRHIYICSEHNAHFPGADDDGAHSLTHWFGYAWDNVVFDTGFTLPFEARVLTDAAADDVNRFLYVADGAASTVYRCSIATDGSLSSPVEIGSGPGTGDGQFEWPEALAVDGEGYVYVVDSRNHRIQEFDSAGNFVTKWGGLGTGTSEFVHPYDIAIDEALHRLYVMDSYNGRVQVFRYYPENRTQIDFVTEWGSWGSPTMPARVSSATPQCQQSDFDDDCDVDLADLNLFQNCFNGPNRPYKPGGEDCAAKDYDSDEDVDLGDFLEFQECFNGPNQPPNEPGGPPPPPTESVLLNMLKGQGLAVWQRVLYVGSSYSGSSGAFVPCYSPPQDGDNDGDVDLADFNIFQNCFNGPNRPYKPGADAITCACLDNDGDADVDLADFGVFQGRFNGPNRPPKVIQPPGGDGLQGDSMFAFMERDGLDSFDVTFALQSPQAGQTIAAGDPVEWHAMVTVTGNNQGLGGYIFNLFLGPNTGPEPGPDEIWGTPDDANLADIVIDRAVEAEVFAVAGANGKPTVGAPASFSGSNGGPGMSKSLSYGYNARPGTLLQVGNGHLDWNPWRYATLPPPAGWRGTHTWGIGLDNRKQTLLLNTTGDYELNAGWIDTTSLAVGHYVLTLVPDAHTTVLDPIVDLSVTQPGGLVLPAESVSGPVSIEFDVAAP